LHKDLGFLCTAQSRGFTVGVGEDSVEVLEEQSTKNDVARRLAITSQVNHRNLALFVGSVLSEERQRNSHVIIVTAELQLERVFHHFREIVAGLI